MRWEVQGLRAVAVLLVLLFHLWPNRVPGGYVGVDVFFVISGFLITSLLLREVRRSGSVSLREFWARRVRRLLPAAFLVLAVSAVGVIALEPRSVWPQFFREILAAGLYVENWVLAIDSVDYLAAENTPSPAQHYWTLSAEEQFYLVWPLLVLVGLWLGRRALRDGPGGPSSGTRPDGPGGPSSGTRPDGPGGPSSGTRPDDPRGTSSGTRPVFAVLAVAVAASLAYSLWLTSHDPATAYFVTPTRAWEFGAGALLAFAPDVHGRERLRAVGGWLALAVLVVCALVFDQDTPMPGTGAIVVVAASALAIWVGAPAGTVSHARLLTAPVARWLGDISYSVYLWHWPLIILLPGLLGHDLTRLDKVSILLATLGLAALTKRFVEDPVRLGRRFGLKRPWVTFSYAALAAAVLAVLCLVPRQSAVREDERAVAAARAIAEKMPPCFGAAARDPQAVGCPNPDLDGTVVPAPSAAREDTPTYSACYAKAFQDGAVPCRFGTPSSRRPHVAVIGDSHARVLMTTVEPLVEQGLLTADMFVIGECGWSTTPPDERSEIGRACAKWRSELYPYLRAHAKDYDLVLTTARLATLRGTHQQQVDGLVEAWREMTDRGVPVAVVRDNPGGGTGSDRSNPNPCLEEVPLREANETCSLDRATRLDDRFDALHAAQERTPRSTFVDLTDLMCDRTTCPVVIGGAGVYSDGNHLTRTFARTLAPYLLRALQGAGLLQQS